MTLNCVVLGHISAQVVETTVANTFLSSHTAPTGRIRFLSSFVGSSLGGHYCRASGVSHVKGLVTRWH